MPVEVIDQMFHRDDIAASSNHAPGWEKTPEWMHFNKPRLTEAPEEGWGQSFYSTARSSGSKMLLHEDSGWEDIRDCLEPVVL